MIESRQPVNKTETTPSPIAAMPVSGNPTAESKFPPKHIEKYNRERSVDSLQKPHLNVALAGR